MLVHEVGQGSVEWLQARLGIPTASKFDKLITPGGKSSKQAEDYANQLIAEMITGTPCDTFQGNEWTERGLELEASAVGCYELLTESEAREVGFVTDDDFTMGCSPDRLVGDDGLLELKCPAAKTHVGYMFADVAGDYKCQVQGQLLVTGRKWVDVISYHPEMRPVIVRAERDEAFIAALRDALTAFNSVLAVKCEYLHKSGYMDKTLAEIRALRLAAKPRPPIVAEHANEIMY